MEFNLAKKEAKFDLRLAYALFPEKIISKKHNSYWTTKQSVWHSKFQLYELLQYLFPEFKEHLSSQEFSLAKNMLNRKLILQTGTSDSNSALVDLTFHLPNENLHLYRIYPMIYFVDTSVQVQYPYR